MNTLDPRNIISLEAETRARRDNVALRTLLQIAHADVAKLLCLCKEAHAAQLHPGHALSIRLAVAIRDLDPNWEATHTLIGKDPAKR